MQRPLNILLVEPNDDMARVLARTLNTERHAVARAGNLAEARTLCEVARFDLIITDLHLPDGDADELIADGTPCRRTPAIVLSVHDADDDRARTAAAGFHTHLRKPVTIKDLWSAIKQATGA
jgi:CheY-like chemotaxis protein